MSFFVQPISSFPVSVIDAAIEDESTSSSSASSSSVSSASASSASSSSPSSASSESASSVEQSSASSVQESSASTSSASSVQESSSSTSSSLSSSSSSSKSSSSSSSTSSSTSSSSFNPTEAYPICAASGSTGGGWYCCCAAPAEHPCPSVVCDQCLSANAPPVTCVAVRDVKPGNPRCADGINGEYLLPHWEEPLPPGFLLDLDLHTCQDKLAFVVGGFCIWFCEQAGAFPAPGPIAVLLYACSNGKFYLELVLGGSAIYIKEYDAKPDCLSFNGERLEVFATNPFAVCDFSASYVLINALRQAPRESDCCSPQFGTCYAPHMTRYFELELSGFGGGSGCQCSAIDCAAMNGTYLLECGQTQVLDAGGHFVVISGWIITVALNCLGIRYIAFHADGGGLFFYNQFGAVKYLLNITPVTGGKCDEWNSIKWGHYVSIALATCTSDITPGVVPFNVCAGTLADPAVPGRPAVKITVRGYLKPCHA